LPFCEKVAETRTEGLETLQTNLVAAAKMAIDTFNQAAAQRAEFAQTEAARREELLALDARATALAAELEPLKSRSNFKFLRETIGDDDVIDLPAGFLPPPRGGVN
jgi:hypothetical protein